MSVSERSTAEAGPASQGNLFQQTLLRFSAAVAEGGDFRALIRLFCETAPSVFDVSGAYYWDLEEEHLLGADAEGHMAAEFLGTVLPLEHAALATEAIRSRRTLFVNDLDGELYPMAKKFGASALLAAPLVVGGEVVGVAAMLHRSAPHFFNEDIAAKATILATQLGSMAEVARLREASLEERERAVHLVEFTHALQSTLDVENITTLLVERVRSLFAAAFVGLYFRDNDGLLPRAYAAQGVERSLTAAHADTLAHASGHKLLATTASDLPAAISFDPGLRGGIIPFGEAAAVRLRTARSSGVLLVCFPPEAKVRGREFRLLGALANSAGLILANAELYSTTTEQAYELQQLLEISSELGGAANLDSFLERFVVRAAEFLGFARAYVGLVEGDGCRARWAAQEGRAVRLDLEVHSELTKRVLVTREPYWTEDVQRDSASNPAIAGTYDIHQYLAVPLLGSNGVSLGLLGVLDRIDGQPISPEDVRRAKALGAQVSIALESAQNLFLSEQHRNRAENLVQLALELSSSLNLPEFVKSFTLRAADMAGAHAAALVLAQGNALETVFLHEPTERNDRGLPRRLSAALGEYSATRPGPVAAGPAAQLLGSGLATSLGWSDACIVRLAGASDEFLGYLCLGQLSRVLSAEDHELLRAVAGHASVALENSRLFTRIAQSNKQWAEIFDAISDLIVVHDESNRVLRVNRSLAEFIGVGPAELIGVSMRALVSIATEPSALPCPFCRAGMETADEYIHPVLERTYLVSTSRMRGALNDGLQTIHVLKDITDRREVERRYRELFDNTQEGIFFSTPEGRFVEVNDALVRILGYASREELLEIDIPARLYLQPDDRRRFKQQIEIAGAVRNYQEVLRRKDGTLVHTLQNSFAVRDSSGKVIQYRGMMLDITELKTFQSQLQRERDFNSKILNNTQSMILVADTAGLISYANRRCFDSGEFKETDLLGNRLAELVPAARRKMFSEAFEAVIAGQQVDNLELPIQSGTGKVGQFSVNLSPMRDEQGSVTSIVAVMTDITDAALLNAKLMHAEKMAAVGQLVSGVAHEVNNPLTAILGFADLMLEQSDMPDSAKRDLGVIIQEAQRTRQIVQNLLSFARQMPAERKPMDINGILQRTLRLRAYDFSSHGMEIIERFSQSLPEVVGDAHQMQQVFLNIVNNAYDAVREHGQRGRIEIVTVGRGNAVEISFIDNGGGIAHPDRIFDPFFTTKEVGKGTGLGLSICYGIVHEHGGEITCQNNPNGGATFVVSLPCETAAQKAKGARA
ncbi:MAG TPA: PAS domain S-box protein [Terriglobales bacterium]|nr:PAS domain S-box protein [Terriglobales bacterium]